MRISDWSSDVCSSDLHHRHRIELVAERLGKTRIAFIAADADDHAAPGLDVEVATVAFGAHADDALAIVNQFLGADAGMQSDTTIERALDEVRGQPRTGAALIIAEPLRQERKSTRLHHSH